MVTEFRQAMTVSVRSCDLNDFAGSKVAKQTFFSRHIKSYLRLLPTRLKARNNIFTVKVKVRSCDLNDFAGSKVAKQTFFSRHIKSYLRLLPTRLKARNNIFTVKTYYKQQ